MPPKGRDSFSVGMTDPRNAVRMVGYSNFDMRCWASRAAATRSRRFTTGAILEARRTPKRSGCDSAPIGFTSDAAWSRMPATPAKILWLRRTDPALASKVSRWVSVGEYLYSKIFGRMACGVDGVGHWAVQSEQKRLGRRDARRSRRRTGSTLTLAEARSFNEMRREFAERWPALRMAKWLPAVGDGAASNIGSGCFTRNLIAINVGTSGAMRVCWPAERVNIPKGLWCYGPIAAMR